MGIFSKNIDFSNDIRLLESRIRELESKFALLKAELEASNQRTLNLRGLVNRKLKIDDVIEEKQKENNIKTDGFDFLRKSPWERHI